MALNHIYNSVSSDNATVVIIHGMAEHQLRYTNFTQRLVQEGYNTLTMDLPGHGQSSLDTKGHLESVSYIIQEVHDLVVQTPKPRVLFGHSMGSLIARALFYAYPEDFDVIVLSGSPYKPDGFAAIRPFIKTLGLGRGSKPSRFIDTLFNKTLAKDLVDKKTDLDWLSFDRENINQFINDPDCGFPFTYQGYNTLMDLFYTVYEEEHGNTRYDVPTLFVIGAHDPCPNFKSNGFQKAVDILQRNIEPDITTRIYEQSRHELLNDIEKETVADDIIAFIHASLEK